MNTLQDIDRIRRAANGDEQAFEQLLSEHEKSVYNLCLRMTKNPEDALDVSQEVFLRVWKSLGSYQYDAAFSTWLFRIASNACIDFLRARKRRQEASLTVEDEQNGEEKELDMPDPAPMPEQALLQKEQRRQVLAAMDELPPDQREILQLRVVEALPYEQIAEILNVKLGTVKSRLARAREQLRKNLAARNFFDSEPSNKQKAGCVKNEL